MHLNSCALFSNLKAPFWCKLLANELKVRIPAVIFPLARGGLIFHFLDESNSNFFTLLTFWLSRCFVFFKNLIPSLRTAVVTAAAMLKGWCDNSFKYSAATEMKAALVKRYWLNRMLDPEEERQSEKKKLRSSRALHLKGDSSVNTTINPPTFAKQRQTISYSPFGLAALQRGVFQQVTSSSTTHVLLEFQTPGDIIHNA